MAADSGSWMGDASIGWAMKLAKGHDGSLHGVCGNASECETYLEWVRNGMEGNSPTPRDIENSKDYSSSFLALIARPDARIEILTAHGSERYAAPYFAVGAGAVAALGAMFVGADAPTAIEAAKEHGSGAFGEVRTISFKD